MKKQIEKLEEPCLQCIDAVFEVFSIFQNKKELQRIVLECELPEMRRFVNLRDRTFEVGASFYQKGDPRGVEKMPAAHESDDHEFDSNRTCLRKYEPS